jgi:hypothetical protein
MIMWPMKYKFNIRLCSHFFWWETLVGNFGMEVFSTVIRLSTGGNEHLLTAKYIYADTELINEATGTKLTPGVSLMVENSLLWAPSLGSWWKKTLPTYLQRG